MMNGKEQEQPARPEVGKQGVRVEHEHPRRARARCDAGGPRPPQRPGEVVMLSLACHVCAPPGSLVMISPARQATVLLRVKSAAVPEGMVD